MRTRTDPHGHQLHKNASVRQYLLQKEYNKYDKNLDAYMGLLARATQSNGNYLLGRLIPQAAMLSLAAAEDVSCETLTAV